tara:strand:+ start:903 stop:1055 length:153 start_codon:yes stop_codon:yes gene_type:complete
MAKYQKCIVHLKRAVLNKVSATDKIAVVEYLKIVFDLDSTNYTLELATQG